MPEDQQEEEERREEAEDYVEAVPEEDEEEEMVEEEPEDEEPAFRRQELIERYHVSECAPCKNIKDFCCLGDCMMLVMNVSVFGKSIFRCMDRLK